MQRYKRSDRVNSLLQEEISAIISRELKDPRIGGIVSVTRVEVSPDLRQAKVKVSILGADEEREQTMASLRRAAGFIHEMLLRRVQMRRVPMLEFDLDKNIEYGVQMAETLAKLKIPPA